MEHKNTMPHTLEELSFQLNDTVTDEGTTFDAVVLDDDVLQVTCSNDDEFPINIAQTDTQLLTVSHLCLVSEVSEAKIDEFNDALLQLSPAIPLSSVGKQGDSYILFGAMSLNTTFENIIHELEVQAENCLEVLDAIEEFLQ